MRINESVIDPVAMAEDNKPVNRQRLAEWNKTLQDYKAGKASVDRRITAAEQWWKMRNEAVEEKHGISRASAFQPKSAWLHNVLTNKHADAMESFPEPIVLPREPGDKEEAKRLSSILPVLLAENGFEDAYSQGWWRKLKTGTAVYKVTWDADKLNGLGDLSVNVVDVLNIFWTPGITDIQKSKMVFDVELVDDETLEEFYPQLKGKLGAGNSFTTTRYVYDDHVPTDGKSLVIDVYYKKRVNGKQVLHYAKYVNDVVLYSTENGDNLQQDAMPMMPLQQPGQAPMDNLPMGSTDILPEKTIDTGMDSYDTASSQNGNDIYTQVPSNDVGLYDDGMYPYVFDTLFPVEGSPCGYGYVDIGQNPQMQIDIMDTCMLESFILGAKPRYFMRTDGSINEEEFMDISRSMVHVNGSIDDRNLQVIDYKPLAGTYISAYENKIEELRQTSGNTTTATGASAGGLTSASAVAAMQEASGKLSRDAIRTGYRACEKVYTMGIERIRQFMDLPRQFRITGEYGEQQFTTYDNSGIVPQWQGGIGNEDLGYRLPQFDFDVQPAKKASYNRTAQNDLAIQLYNLGIFNPEASTQAMMLLNIMDFDSKDELMQAIQQTGTIFDKFQQVSQLAVQLMNKYEPGNAPMLAQSLGVQMQGMAAPAAGGQVQSTANNGDTDTGENPIVARARDRANRAASV